MAIINATKYDPAIPVETQLEKSMSADEFKRWQNQPKPHQCQPPSLREGEYGPGTVCTCAATTDGTTPCHSQKRVVHLGIKQETDILDEDGKKVTIEIPPLAWRNLGNNR